MKSYRYPPDLNVKEKRCIGQCASILPVASFGISKTNTDGYANECKTCRNQKAQLRYQKNPEPIKIQANNYYKNNPEKVRESRRKTQKKKLASDPLFRLIRNLRNRTWYAFHNKGWDKNCSFDQYIGCNYDELLHHVESQWTLEMTWQNYGTYWEIDHINALSLSIDENDAYKKCHYTNLRPLTVTENRIKNNHIQDFQNYKIILITFDMYKDFLDTTHYLENHPGAQYYYGLFFNDELVGVCSYGIPSMPSIAKSFVHESMTPFVLELKRFALKNNKPNEGSYFLSRTLKLLPTGHFIITYADPSQNHNGTIYKACNFIEKGLTQKKKNYIIRGKEHLHPRSLEKYTDETTEYVDRVQKHRYIYITGNSKTKNRLTAFVK